MTNADEHLKWLALTFADTYDTEAPPRLFGHWRQPLTDVVKPTPIGAQCFICREPFVGADTGEFLTTRVGQHQIPVHVECLVLLFMGHQLGVCQHTRYADCINEDGSPNLRNAALVAGLRMASRADLVPWSQVARACGEPS